MTNETPYGRYAGDQRHMREYVAYQERYVDNIRESDRILIDLVTQYTRDASLTTPAIIDVGCSTGNLLRHLRSAIPSARLCGVDLAEDAIATCRADPDLTGIDFATVDIVRGAPPATYDVVTVDAVFFVMDHSQLSQAVQNIARALHPGGLLACFDLFHPFGQELLITETSAAHPQGLQLVLRSYAALAEALTSTGFSQPSFHPFFMPFPLARPEDSASLQTYTEETVDGRFLSFRGALSQPWCHATAVLESI